MVHTPSGKIQMANSSIRKIAVRAIRDAPERSNICQQEILKERYVKQCQKWSFTYLLEKMVIF